MHVFEFVSLDKWPGFALDIWKGDALTRSAIIELSCGSSAVSV